MDELSDDQRHLLWEARVQVTLEWLRSFLTDDPPPDLERFIRFLRWSAQHHILNPTDSLATLGYTTTMELGWEGWERRLREAGFDPEEAERVTRVARERCIYLGEGPGLKSSPADVRREVSRC